MTTPLIIATTRLRAESSFRDLKTFHDSQPITYSTVETDGKYVWMRSGEGSRKMLNVSSAVYLSLSNHRELLDAMNEANGRFGSISGASRLNYKLGLEEQLEEKVSGLMGAEATLFFQTTSLASLGVITALCHTPNDVIIFDQYCHRTLQKAIQLARSLGATTVKIPHDDAAELERALIEHDTEGKGNILVAVDGVYSMSGNVNDLRLFDSLARKHGAFLYIDDAHGFAVMGEGRGVIGHLDLPLDNVLYVGGFSKSFGGYGSFVSCPRKLAEYIKLTAYTYNFAGPLPTASYAFNLRALDILEKEGTEIRGHLFAVSKHLIDGLREIGYTVDNRTNFPIICPIVGDDQLVHQIAREFFERNVMILPVCYPVVPRGQSLIRMTPNAAHTVEEMDRLLEVFRENYDAGRVYSPA